MVNTALPVPPARRSPRHPAAAPHPVRGGPPVASRSAASRGRVGSSTRRRRFSRPASERRLVITTRPGLRAGRSSRNLAFGRGVVHDDQGPALAQQTPQPFGPICLTRRYPALGRARGPEQAASSARSPSRENPIDMHMHTYVTELALAAESSRLPGWHVICGEWLMTARETARRHVRAWLAEICHAARMSVALRHHRTRHSPVPVLPGSVS